VGRCCGVCDSQRSDARRAMSCVQYNLTKVSAVPFGRGTPCKLLVLAAVHAEVQLTVFVHFHACMHGFGMDTTA
jgi:hypothetical protein